MPWTNHETRRRVTTGEWELDIVDGSFDHLRFDGVEVLRALRVVVRDHDWRTVPAVVDDVTVTEGAAGLQVAVTGHHAALGAGTSWSARLTVDRRRLRFEVDVVVTRAFRRNRIGLVILHPARLAGTALVVEHTEDTATPTVFPRQIEPHQPALDVAGLRWSAGGLDVALRLEGDVFEMEDQRNWTDASFKTYGTPLSLPFPVEVGPGERIRQSVTVDVSGSAEAHQDDGGGLTPTARTVPSIAVGSSTAPGTTRGPVPWTKGLVQLVELDLRDPAWTRVLARARHEAAGAPLDVRLVTDAPERLDAALTSLGDVPLARLGVFDSSTHSTTPALWHRLVAGASIQQLSGDLVGGTRAHFTELNRTRGSQPADLPALTFSLTPQMHDVSTDQVDESLAMQRAVAVESTRIAGGRPVHIGPVTLRARFNAVATSQSVVPVPDPSVTGYGPEFVWNSTDDRQHTAEYAAWLLASFIALAVEGVESATYAESWGPRGFGSRDGVPDPAATVLGWLSDAAGSSILDVGAVPAGSAVLAFHEGDRVVVLIANTTSAPLSVTVLGATHALDPHAVARVLADAP